MEKEQAVNQESQKEETVEEVKESVEEKTETIEEIDEKTHQEEIAERMRELEQMKKDFFQRDVEWTLKKNGLEAFAEIIHVEDDAQLDHVVKQLTKIVNDIKLSVGYVPKENAKQDDYDLHTKNKDTKSMIGSKLSRIFK
ncbi:hypothetical protein MUB24_12845 [Lederbergia sp. NSJ-179]|uniref:hypothetical protein n=1 Tax=Lederbergia sp. NSJ-179 TaxID=2931402 RepID=UPI001FD4C773|nr:hypothetical protein [Lederbergia sp. NSJ-179]MCJ7841770.1 hypothetical protein [Lederbergia sp. NSJ-179]